MATRDGTRGKRANDRRNEAKAEWSLWERANILCNEAQRSGSENADRLRRNKNEKKRRFEPFPRTSILYKPSPQTIRPLLRQHETEALFVSAFSML
jgi:hypothetical protein